MGSHGQRHVACVGFVFGGSEGKVMASGFVRVNEPSDDRGVGKLEFVGDGVARIEYFTGPTEDTFIEEAPVRAVRGVKLCRQTRVYWQDRSAGVWRVGRVLCDDDSEVEVQFPNKERRSIPASEIFVRCNRPIADPTPYLAQRLNETPLFGDTRSGFVGALIAQRAACLGMSALLSSVIDLEAHQIEVVRRVLQDPVQRYLLADEVGLGKTIEGGVLIRQYVLDDPRGHRITVAVPPALVRQWRDELKRRFLLGYELDRTINVVPTDDIDRLAGCLADIGMLVVDEAHHLSGDRRLYETVRRAAHGIPRLLLLSATPVLGNERGFLEMLHLLDPVVFRPDSEDSFRNKILHRQAVAETVAALVPENLLQLDDFLDALDARFPDDSLLGGHVGTLRSITAELPEETDERFLTALSAVRAHLSETYRLDRRILRNRRRNLPVLTPGRAGAVVIDHASPAVAGAFLALEGWRSLVAARLHGAEDSPTAERAAAWFADAAGAILSEPNRLAELVSDRRKRCRAEGDTDEAPLLARLLSATKSLLTDSSRREALAEFLIRDTTAAKFVVFCSTEYVADRLTVFLGERTGRPAVRHSPEDLRDGIPSWQPFIDDPRHRILVCDRRAEEGLNLQGADMVVVHYDLPLAPNRVEQRLGRADRYGSGNAVRSVVLRCTDNPFEVAWTRCLDEGLGVFDRSIASLQYLVEGAMRLLSQLLLTEGVEAMDDLTSRLRGPKGEVALELRRIDEQDSLDALAAPAEDGLDALEEVDDDWRDFRAKVEGWVANTLLMSRDRGPDVGPLADGDAVFRFGLNLGSGESSLIPLDRFIETMVPSLDRKAPGASHAHPPTYPFTYRRRTALSPRGRAAGLRLLRYGEAFLHGLGAITALDDRGRVVALWRHVPGYRGGGDADVFFRFDFLVETDVGPATVAFGGDAAMTAAALSRRGDMMFPPSFRRIWLDGELQPVDDEGLVTLLDAPYRKAPGRGRDDGRVDRNLNHRRWDAVRRLGLPVMADWQSLVMAARAKAEVELCRRAAVRERAEQAVARAREIDEGRFAQLEARIRVGDGASVEADLRHLETERRVALAMYEGMRKPRISLDTIGALFLSGRQLDGAWDD